MRNRGALGSPWVEVRMYIRMQFNSSPCGIFFLKKVLILVTFPIVLIKIFYKKATYSGSQLQMKFILAEGQGSRSLMSWPYLIYSQERASRMLASFCSTCFLHVCSPGSPCPRIEPIHKLNGFSHLDELN